jgi:hypothetical protein
LARAPDRLPSERQRRQGRPEPRTVWQPVRSRHCAPSPRDQRRTRAHAASSTDGRCLILRAAMQWGPPHTIPVPTITFRHVAGRPRSSRQKLPRLLRPAEMRIDGTHPDVLRRRGQDFNPKVPGSRPGRPTSSEGVSFGAATDLTTSDARVGNYSSIGIVAAWRMTC